MNAPALSAVLLLGAAYCFVGILFGELAREAASRQMVVAWRWAAWVVSGIGFGAHIVYEQVRLRSSPRITALHVSWGAAVGAFGLAAAANFHAQSVAPHHRSLLLALSLVIWPVMTVLPAFVVALVAATLLARARRGG